MKWNCSRNLWHHSVICWMLLEWICICLQICSHFCVACFMCWASFSSVSFTHLSIHLNISHHFSTSFGKFYFRSSFHFEIHTKIDDLAHSMHGKQSEMLFAAWWQFSFILFFIFRRNWRRRWCGLNTFDIFYLFFEIQGAILRYEICHRKSYRAWLSFLLIPLLCLMENYSSKRLVYGKNKTSKHTAKSVPGSVLGFVHKFDCSNFIHITCSYLWATYYISIWIEYLFSLSRDMCVALTSLCGRVLHE